MIDTLEVRFSSPEPVASPAIVDSFRRSCRGNVRATSVHVGGEEVSESAGEVSWLGEVPGLGVVRLDRTGHIWQGGSLAKTHEKLCGVPHHGNAEVLTAREVDEACASLLSTVADRFPWVDPGSVHVRRADICYQRPVSSSAVVLARLEGAMKTTRGGTAWFDNAAGVATGLFCRGRAVSHRVYDKGLESGIDDYRNVLRSEEQLRSGAAGLRRIAGEGLLMWDREACREVMNERYLEYAGGVEELDVSEHVKTGRYAVALFALHPELLHGYKAQVKEAMWRRMRAEVREVRASAVPVDLRLPAEAWT